MVDLHADALLPKPWPSWAKRCVWASAAVLLLVCGLYGWSCVERHKAATHEASAEQAHESTIIHAAQGATYDQQAQAQAPEIQAAEHEVERLRAELARLRHPAPPPDSQTTPSEPSIPLPVQTPVDLAPVVAKLEELVKAQDREISGLKAQVATLTSARDSWRLAAQDSGREALQLRASLAAREGLEKSALWKGRIQGFAVGIASGYVAGRIR